MSTEQNRTRMRRIPEEIFNQGRLALADELFAVDYIEHAPLPPSIPSGLEGFKAFVTALRAAFPDFHYTVEDEIGEGDKIVQRLTARGTHKGQFLGMPATGKQATWTEIHVARLSGGKLVEHWVNQDQLGMLQQLGIVPMPGQGGS
jgi:predicted ester cyclase